MQVTPHSILWLLALHLTVLPAQAWAGWSLVLDGRVERVVVTADHVAALRGQTVFLMLTDGSRMGQIAQREKKSRRAAPRYEPRAREDVLDFLGIDESEQDNSWVEDELNNESTLMQRRQKREAREESSELPIGAPTITAGPHDIWIANGRGLWFWPDDGDVLHVSQRPLSGALLTVLARARVLISAGDQLWVVAASGSRRQLANAESLRHLAVSPSGRSMAWANTSQLELRDDIDGPRRIVALSQPLRALRYCDDALLLLSQAGLALVAPAGTPLPLALPLDAHRLACGASGPWLASAPDLLVSEDQGHTWNSIAIPLTARVLDAALDLEGAYWVATDKGLFRVTGPSTGGDPLPDARSRSPRAVVGPRAAPWWTAWLPHLTVAGGAFLARGERDIDVMTLASFPLDAPTPRRSSRLVADNSEVPVSHEPQTINVTLPPDSDAACLEATRSRAVSLAMVEPDRARSYVNRARRAAWLPELRLRADRRFGRRESLDVPSISTTLTSPLGLDTVDDVRYEARLTWDLARLVFSHDELAAQSQSMHMAEMRRDIELTVSRLYFERRRLRLDAVSASAGERTLKRELRLREIEAELDALSDGGFSQCTAGRTIGQGDS